MFEQENNEITNLNVMKAYFSAWNNHDINKLDKLVAEKITLEDWEISAYGRTSFLKANQKIFSDNKGIFAKLINSFVKGDEIIAILEIHLSDTKEKLAVIDHFTFKSSKIMSIKAYRGF